MNPTGAFLAAVLLLQLLPGSLSAHADGRKPSNITVIGTVFCDICSNNTFTKHSFFLQGAKVQVECSFKANSTTREEISITVDRTTDRLGIYRIDIPPVDGLECRQGRQLESFCRAKLLQSSSSVCNVPGLSTSAEHQAVKFSHSSLCVYNLNALNYRPRRKDTALCGTGESRGQLLQTETTIDTSLFFWPPFPPFTPPWPFPFPYPTPPSFPFPFPFPYPTPFPFPFPFPLPFTPSPAPTFPFPFPFFAPPPPAFPFPFPPLGPIPNPFAPPPPPPAFPFPPLPPLSPIPNPFTPSPPPPSPPPPLIPFPPFPPLGPIPNPFTPPSPPPPSPPPPPSFPFPFPPFPPFQSSPPPPPPPSFSLWNPKSWFQPPSQSPHKAEQVP